MAKKKVVKKKRTKKAVLKNKPVKRISLRKNFIDSVKEKKKRLTNVLWRSAILFVIFFVLYYITDNLFLWELFVLLAIIFGAVVLTLLLILLSFWIANKRKN